MNSVAKEFRHTYTLLWEHTHRIRFSESENVVKAFSDRHDVERCARERDNGNAHTETADKRKKLAYSVRVDFARHIGLA